MIIQGAAMLSAGWVGTDWLGMMRGADVAGGGLTGVPVPLKRMQAALVRIRTGTNRRKRSVFILTPWL
jgi:hypothetical protein